MWIATVLFWGFATWLVVSPDKHSLTASRGLWGAARGWANPEYPTTKTKAAKTKAAKGKNGKSKAHASRAAQGSRWHGMLAGWNAGVTVARQRRDEGRDLWSIGSKFAGRTWGGGESLAVGVRRLRSDLGAWYRSRQYAADGPIVQGAVIDDGPAASKTDTRDNDPADSPDVRADPAFTSVSEGGEVHDSDRYDLGVVHDIDPYGYDRKRPRLLTACNRCADKKLAGDAEGLDPEFAREGTKYVFSAPVDFGTGGTWTCPVCGETYDPTTYPRPSKDLAAMAAGGAPAEGVGAPSSTNNTTTPAFAGGRMDLMSDMSIGELENLGAMKAEGVDSAGTLIAMLGESMAAAKTWAPGFQDRWAGADWGTERINNAVAMIAEGAEALGTTELMEAGVAELQAALEEAQTLAEMAAEVKATGDVSRFAEA